MNIGPRTCQGLNCQSTKLIDSHIIARGFARLTRNEGRNITVSEERVGLVSPQLGYFDKNILCASCDNKLGAYDDYVIELCRNFEAKHRRLSKNLFEIPTVDCNKVATFFLSVLWRASISKRPEYKAISLGSLEDRAREIIFKAAPPSSLPQFKLIVLRLESTELDVLRFYTMPQRVRFREWNMYRMSLNGFRFIAFLDARNPPLQIKPMILNGGTTLRGLYMTLEDSDEFKQMAALANPMKRFQRQATR
jgi:hypothetical protein